jgi:hypothetical protein
MLNIIFIKMNILENIKSNVYLGLVYTIPFFNKTRESGAIMFLQVY